IFVTSDIEGNFNAFYSMLTGNGIMDRDYNWTFGTGHLVVAGDMVDRGNNAWPCLWLLYKLEQDAEKAGGQVHYILGNHDVMNMHANVKYVKRRYIELAKIVSGKEDEKEAYRYLLSSTNEIAKWIASKNTVEKIGDALYVHGGISTEVVDAGLSIEEINAIVRKNIRRDLTNDPGDDEVENMVFGRLGPLWYRGLVKDYKEHYEKTTSNELHQILDFFGVKRIVVGHTIVDEQVTSDFEGRVIRVDIKHPHEKFTGKSQGLLIESGQDYKVKDHGEKDRLSMTTVH
ncbi:MAG: metallophosphoesterase, partial [Flavobacteriaceae bacterium]